MGSIKGSPSWARYKNKKRLNRKGVNYLPNLNYLKLSGPIDDADRDNLVAPKNFSIIDNSSGVIEYINKVLSNVNARKYSIMNMTGIEKTDLATISVVISVMMDRRYKEAKIRKYVNVHTPPRDTPPGKLFEKAQFRETVTEEGIANHTRFLSRLDTTINAEFIRDMLDYSKKFLGDDSIKSLSPILVEIMQNTNNHANPDNLIDSGNIPWFAALLEDEEKGKMIFSVVDLGIGVFESLKRKGLTNTDNQFEDAIKDLYDNSQSKFLKNSIPKGVDSSTGLFYRGQGLQTVYTLANSGNYGTFTIVTNRALVNLINPKKVSKDSSESFGGTVFYWEMSKNG